MALRIEVSGPAKYALVGVVLFFVLGAWLAPSLVSSVAGSSGYSYSYLRGGYVEQHKTNLTGHWITTANGRYRSMPFFAFAGENVVIGHDVDVRDGRVVVRVRHYVWNIVPERGMGRAAPRQRRRSIHHLGARQRRVLYRTQLHRFRRLGHARLERRVAQCRIVRGEGK
jgi:hypothetical protein